MFGLLTACEAAPPGGAPNFLVPKPAPPRTVVNSSLRAVGLLNPDSIVLERTPCFGACPAYRVRIERGGAVAFRARHRGDTTRTQTGFVAAQDLEDLLQRLETLGFEELPDTIASSPGYCGPSHTDAATVISTVFAGTIAKQVVDYQGCRWAPIGLRELEEFIDHVANTRRWTSAGDTITIPAPPA